MGWVRSLRVAVRLQLARSWAQKITNYCERKLCVISIMFMAYVYEYELAQTMLLLLLDCTAFMTKFLGRTFYCSMPALRCC